MGRVVSVEPEVEFEFEPEKNVEPKEEEEEYAARLASLARAVTCKTTALTPALHLSFSFLACSSSFSVLEFDVEGSFLVPSPSFCVPTVCVRAFSPSPSCFFTPAPDPELALELEVDPEEPAPS